LKVESTASDLSFHGDSRELRFYNVVVFIVAAENRHCSVALTAEPQHILSNTGRLRPVQPGGVGCGTDLLPWSIEGLAGQRISVSVIEFSTKGSFVFYVCARDDTSIWLLTDTSYLMN